MATRPSMAFFGDDLPGAAEPGSAPWAQGPASPVAPPAGILQDPNVMWLDPGLLMEPGTGFGSAQKSDALGQAIDQARAFLDGGGRGRSGGRGGIDPLKSAEAIAKNLPRQQPVGPTPAFAMSPGQQVETFMTGTGPEAANVGLEFFGPPQTPADIEAFSQLQGAPPGELSVPGFEYPGSTALGTAATAPAGAASVAGPYGGVSDIATGAAPTSTLGTAAGYAGQALPYVAAALNAYSRFGSGDQTPLAKGMATARDIAGAVAAPFTYGLSVPAAQIINMLWAHILRDKGMQRRGGRMMRAGRMGEALGAQLQDVTSENLADVLARPYYLPEAQLQPGVPGFLGTADIDYSTGTFTSPGYEFSQDFEEASPGGMGYQPEITGPLRTIGSIGSLLREIAADPRTGGEYGNLAPLLEGYGPTSLSDRYGYGRIGSVGEMLSHSGGTPKDRAVGPQWAQLLAVLDQLAGEPGRRAEAERASAAEKAARGLQQFAGGPGGGRGSDEEELLNALAMLG